MSSLRRSCQELLLRTIFAPAITTHLIVLTLCAQSRNPVLSPCDPTVPDMILHSSSEYPNIAFAAAKQQHFAASRHSPPAKLCAIILWCKRSMAGMWTRCMKNGRDVDVYLGQWHKHDANRMLNQRPGQSVLVSSQLHSGSIGIKIAPLEWPSRGESAIKRAQILNWFAWC